MLCLLIVLCAARANEGSYYTLYSNNSHVLKSVKQRTDKDEIHFFLFTRLMPNQRVELKINDTKNLMKSSFSFNQTTKVIINGWIANKDTLTALENLKNAYIKATDFNIIIVDWSKLASGQYKVAASFINAVSLLLIDFINFLKAHKFSFTRLHLIGHCLGAHVASFVGKYFRTQKTIIDAITGLDPAYPLFKFKAEEELLHLSDARYVEVIHTNTDTWGFRNVMGHVDFYPNGGKIQPGCEEDIRGLCAHNRAIEYYAESIVSATPFTAIYCEKFEVFHYYRNRPLNMSGVHLNYGVEGMYFLITNHQSPFPVGDPYKWKIFEQNDAVRFIKYI